MGQTDSKQLIVCSFCKSEIITPDGEGNEQKSSINIHSQPMLLKLPSNAILCPRCHGFYQKQAEHYNNKRMLSFFGNENTDDINGDNKDNNIKIYIKHLHIAPFEDTVNDIEEKEISNNYMTNKYLKPYFNANKHIKITNGNRIIIKNVEFKVFGCYPPQGYVNQLTQFHLNDNNGKLIKLKWRPIRQIHLLPTKASHLTYNKIKQMNGNDMHGNDEMKQQSDEQQSNEQQSNEQQSNEQQSNEQQSNEQQSNEQQSNEININNNNNDNNDNNEQLLKTHLKP
eukprot:136720_1